MDLVPRLLGIALVGFALAGSGGSAMAADTSPDNGTLLVSSALLSHSAQDPLMPDAGSKFQAQSRSSDRQSSLDFFSVHPRAGSSDFTSLLGSSAGGGGLKFHLNW